MGNNRGQITVFLCIVLTSILLIGFTALERVRISMGSAKAAEAARGAVNDVRAAYNKPLFERYHLLAIDKEFDGQGEGKIEQMVEDYLTYTLDNDQEDSMKVEQVALADCKGLLDNDCESMKEQIRQYMKEYVKEEGITDLLEMLTTERKAGEKSENAVKNGRNDTSEDEQVWVGRDPRKVVRKMTRGGVLRCVVPAGKMPSADKLDLSDMPSKDKCKDSPEWEDIEFDDIDVFENSLRTDRDNVGTKITDNFYGICYVTEFLNNFTDEAQDGVLKCEVEYIISGKSSDQENLKGVVNRIILHRLPVNLAYLVSDKSKVSSVAPIAFVLSLIPGVTYPAAKYLLLGCWAYAETLVDIKVLLSGHSVQFFKTDETWVTDIDNLGKLKSIENEDYEGTDSINYKGYLSILLAENTGNLYYRLADIIQMNLSQDDEGFDIRNMIYGFSVDVDVSQKKKYAYFIEDQAGVDGIDKDMYRYVFRMTTSY